jgi:hypothetical protein
MGIILIPTAAFTGHPYPFSVMARQIKGTHHCIERLNEAVELTPSTLWQFQMLEGKKLWKEVTPTYECHGCDSELIDENEFLDTYENLP